MKAQRPRRSRTACAAVVPLAVLIVASMIGAATAWAAPLVRTPGYRGITRPVAVTSPVAPSGATLGQGTRPDLIVDAAGTAHIVWTVSPIGSAAKTVYCRVPRGARSCDVVRELVPPGADEYSGDVSGPTVTAVNDQVVVLSHRYPQTVKRPDGSTGSGVVYMWTSDDGGQTFTTGAMVASGNGPNTAVAGDLAGGSVSFGPADNPSIAFATGVVTGGVSVTTVTAGRYTPLGAAIAPGDYVDARLAVVDGRPLVVYRDLSGHAYVRRWTGVGDPNDAATWTPQAPLDGFTPAVTSAGGRAIVALGSSLLSGTITVRPVVGDGPATVVGRGANANIAGMADGRARVGWSDVDGTWTALVGADGRIVAPAALVGPAAGFARLAVAGDGGGMVVGEGDGGTIILNAVGTRTPTGLPGLGGRPGGGALPPDAAEDCQRIRFGALEALLQDGCFLNAATGRAKITTGALRLNGLDIIPDAGVQIIIDARARTIDTTGTVTVLLRAGGVPDITLYRGRLNLRLAAARGGSSLFSFTKGMFPTTVLGFPLRGDVDVRLTDRGVTIPVNLGLPVGFGGVTGAATLRADNARGLVIDSLEFRADNVPVGVALMRRLHVQYRAFGGTAVGDCLRPPTSGAPASPNEWAGVFELQLPPPESGPALCGSVRFGDGAFRAATFNIDLPAPGLVLFPGISVTSVGGGLALRPPQIDAAMRISAIPVSGGGLVNIDGRVSARFGSPFQLRGEGRYMVSGIDLGSGGFVMSSDGYLRVRMTAGPEIGPLAVRVNAAGFVDAPRREFSVSGRGEVCLKGVCEGAGAVLSTRGIAACLPAPTVPRGAGYRWGEPVIGGVDIWLVSCDMDDYRVADTRAQELRAHEAGPSAIASVSGRPASVSFRVRGVGGVPSITVIGPRGQAVTPTATFADDQSATLFVAVSKPAPGTYTLQAAPGTPAIGEVAVSRQVAPAAIVRARVTGRGRAPRTLTYRARIGANQSIAFAERFRAGTRLIGTARAGTRRLRFTPGPGPGGRRDIVALVSQNGLVRSERIVARFSAPPPARVGRARGLRVRRAGRNLVATWRPGAGLATQRVQVALADGRVIVRGLGPRARRIAVAGVRRGDRVRVMVIGQARDGRLGAPAQRRMRLR